MTTTDILKLVAEQQGFFERERLKTDVITLRTVDDKILTIVRDGRTFMPSMVDAQINDLLAQRYIASDQKMSGREVYRVTADGLAAVGVRPKN